MWVCSTGITMQTCDPDLVDIATFWYTMHKLRESRARVWNAYCAMKRPALERYLQGKAVPPGTETCVCLSYCCWSLIGIHAAAKVQRLATHEQGMGVRAVGHASKSWLPNHANVS